MLLMLKIWPVIFQVSFVFGYPGVNPTSEVAAQPTFCGDVIRKSIRTLDKQIKKIYAPEVFKCFMSVPFNPAVASRFVKYSNDTLQFHSTVPYLRHPPSGYQQPAVDLIKQLNMIQQKVDESLYQNQYNFEEDVQSLIYSAHDIHLGINGGVLSSYRFKSPFRIVSWSSDGREEPKVYILQDAERDASPIASINGLNATDYLIHFAQRHSPGHLDPHADWNSLMYSPAQNISIGGELFQDLVLYPGDDIQITLDNGTVLGPQQFQAKYVESRPPGPLETGDDFYNYFVLGYYPWEFYINEILPNLDWNSTSEPTATVQLDRPSPTPNISLSTALTGWSEVDSAWPRANLLQADIGGMENSRISGYFINGTEIAVLNILSFEVQGFGVDTFTAAVQKFIEESVSLRKSRILIDLQRNSGGLPTLAVDTFKRFFPDIEPYIATRMRAQDMVDDLGTQIDGLFSEWLKNYSNLDTNTTRNFYYNSTSEWVASNRINPETNKPFKDWSEFFGPVSAADSTYTNVQLYNYSDPYFTTRSLAHPESLRIVYGYPGNPANTLAAFPAENITILTDGLCESACALFVEIMRIDAGVRTIVVGGRPNHGPMQATSSRGTRYRIKELDSDIRKARRLAKEKDQLTPSLPERVNDFFMWWGTINMRNFMRKGEDVPLQFLYDAADCRIYYTKETVFNQTALWISAVENSHAQGPESLCVPGSTTRRAPPPAQKLTLNTTMMMNITNDFPGGLLSLEVTQLGDEGKQAWTKEDLMKIGHSCGGNNDECKSHFDPLPMKCTRMRKCDRHACVPRCVDVGWCNNEKLSGICNKSGWCDPNEIEICGVMSIFRHSTSGPDR